MEIPKDSRVLIAFFAGFGVATLGLVIPSNRGYKNFLKMKANIIEQAGDAFFKMVHKLREGENDPEEVIDEFVEECKFLEQVYGDFD